MEQVWLSPDWLFSDGVVTRDQAIRLENRQVVEIVAKASLRGRAGVVALTGGLSAGLIDLQVNGGGGVLFNASPTPAGITAIIAAHRSFGTGWILPTVISDTEAVLERAVAAVIGAWGTPGLAGIHIEGPHISRAKRGTHPPEVLRPLGDHTLGLIHTLRARGIPTKITVAPEVVSPEQIQRLVRSGVLVSLGHSDASYAQTCAALDAGAHCFTHLFNAMSQMTSRAPGMVAAALGSRAYAGFICDGHHVSDATLAVALSAGDSKQRMFLVSDAMPTVGGPDRFTLGGMEVGLTGGKLINPEGNLAGAHITMAQSLARAVSHLGLSVEEALRMGLTVPASVIDRAAYAALLGAGIDDLLLWGPALEGCQWLDAERLAS